MLVGLKSPRIPAAADKIWLLGEENNKETSRQVAPSQGRNVQSTLLTGKHLSMDSSHFWRLLWFGALFFSFHICYICCMSSDIFSTSGFMVVFSKSLFFTLLHFNIWSISLISLLSVLSLGATSSCCKHNNLQNVQYWTLNFSATTWGVISSLLQ